MNKYKTFLGQYNYILLDNCEFQFFNHLIYPTLDSRNFLSLKFQIPF